MNARRLVAIVLLITCTSFAGYTQTADSTINAGMQVLPEPYDKDEFPEWMNTVRRYEIVSLGAFPILLFYTRFGFEIQRFIQSGFSASYVPWPFKNESSYVPTDEEQLQSVLTAAGLAIAFGALDAILVTIKLD